ncbi:MAG TPA: Ig-like domain-containing protein [Acidimicrobiales bacterium]|nr:Ig-like domain-containing protein [Acidimicrobiales bacterium]
MTRFRPDWRWVAVVAVLGLVLGLVPFGAAPAGALTALTVTPITFDVIGLDSNNVATGPDLFPVGARTCNTGDVALTAVSAGLVFEGAINPYLTVSGPSSLAIGTLAPSECRDVYFNVVIARDPAAYDTVQRYFVQVTTAEGVSARTPQPRQLYIENLVSQNRNSVVDLTGPTTVYVGETYTYTLVARTATQGYEQLETFLTLDGVIFQVVSTTSTYSAPEGATNDKLYADACGLQLDPTLPDYRSCVGPSQYPGGKAGGDITVTYVVKVLSAGTTSLVPLIYDLSGASYHYNSDFGALTAMTVTALPASADLSVTKTASTTSPDVGSAVTFTIGLTNGGPTPATGVQVRDLLPVGLSYVSSVPASGTTYDPVTGIWSLASAAVGSTTNLTITATAVSGATMVNTAEVVASSVLDPDSSPDNGIATEDDQASVTLTPPMADLSLTKSVSDATPNVGQQVTYTVSATNSGPLVTATNVQVRDVLPLGLAFVSASASSGSYDVGAGIWTVGSVAVGTPRTLSIVATVTAGGPITNVAQVQAADQLDPDSTAGNSNPAEDDQASATVSAQQADLSVTKSASTLTPNVGANVTFTVGVANAGPDVATNLTVADALPAGLAFVSAAPSQGSYDPSTGAWFVGAVGSGESAQLSIVAQVTGSTPASNTAQVAAVDQRDPDSTPGNGVAGEDDEASVTLTPQQADVSVTKTASTATPNVGETMTFTVGVANAATSNASATTVVVSDVLPAEVVFVSAVGTSGTYDDITGRWTVGSIAPGASEALTLTVRVTGSIAFTNTASVLSVDQFDPDSTPGNGAAGEDDQASVTVTPQRADLSVALSVDDTTPNLGDQVVLTVTLADAGPSAATGVTVSLPLPAGLTFVSASAGSGSYDPGTGVWTVGGVPSGGSWSLQVTATVDDPGAKTVTAWVVTSDQFDPDSTPGNLAVEDDLASVVATPREADLSVTALAGATTVPVGGQTTFTFSVTNGGPSTATGVSLAVPIPTGATFVSSTSAGSFDPTTGIWSVGSLASGTTATLTVTATIITPGAVTASAEVLTVDQHDPDSTPANGDPAEDDLATASVVGVQADLSLTKAVDDVAPNVGDTVVFTVTVANAGPSVATGVSVLDQLPSGLTFASASASQGSYAPGSGLWTVGSIGAGGTAVLTLRAVVASSAPSTNAAEVWTSDLPDPDSTPANGATGVAEDDRATATVSPPVADLSLLLAVADDRPNVGDVTTFTVTLTNGGPSSAAGVTVHAPLPAGFGSVTATPSQGTYDTVTGVWAVGTVAFGAAPTLVLRAPLESAAGTVATAEVLASSVYDPDSTPGNGIVGEDDQASVAVTPRAADLRLTKTVVGSSDVDLGDAVAFTLTLANDGPDSATTIRVVDVLPAGLTFVSAEPGAGSSYDQATGVWSIPSLASGASVSLALTATVTATGAIVNTASVSAVDQFDPDSSPGATSPSEDDTASATVTGLAADLRISKTAPASVPAGQSVEFTITVINDGPSDAEDVVVVDGLPSSLGSPSTSSPRCAIAGGTMTCALGDLASGASVSISVSGTAPASGSADALVNSASVSSSTFDPDPSDDSSSVSSGIVPTLVVGDVSVIEGGVAMVPITLSNPSSVDVTVGYATATGTADATDFTATSGTVTIPAGQVTAVVAVPTTGDSIDEHAETFRLVVEGVPVGATTADGDATATIIDDDDSVDPVDGPIADPPITIAPRPLLPPVATDDAIVTGADGSVTIPVLTNDADADAALDPTRVTIVTAPSHGVATVLTSGQIRYVADAGFSGVDSFTYRLCDAAEQCDDAIVEVTVLERVIETGPTLPRTGAGTDELARTAALLVLVGGLLLVASRRKRTTLGE